MKAPLNENIKSLRVHAGMNQVQLAEKLNVSKQCISNWENDNVQPSIDMLIKISDLFSVSTDQLLGRTAERTLDVSALTDEQFSHISFLVGDLATANRNKK